MITVKDLMTKKLVTIPVGASLAKATELMKEKRIRHLPVIDDRDGIVGVLSSRDLPEYSAVKNASVEFYMSTPVYYLDQGTTLKETIYKMLELKISCLLVSDENNDAVGIVTTDDLLWYLVSKLEKEEQNQPFIKKLLDIPTLGQVAHQLSQSGV